MMSRVTAGPLTPELSSGFTAGGSALWLVLLVDNESSKNTAALHEAVLEEGEEAVSGNDQVVQDGNAQKLPSFNQAAGDFVIFVGRFEVAGWVVVRYDNRGRVVDDRAAEHLPRVYKTAVDDPDAHNSYGRYSVRAVESEDEEMFTPTLPVAFQDLVGVRRCANGDFIFDSSLRDDLYLHGMFPSYQ